MSYLTGFVSCYLADRMRKKNQFHLLTIRRIFISTTFIGPILCICLLLKWGSKRVISVIAFTLWQIFLSTAVASIVAGIVDVSPTYSGSVHGISNGFGGFSGYLSTLLFDVLVNDKQNLDEWGYIFWTIIAINGFALVCYFLIGSADIQKWDPLYRSSPNTENLGT